MQKKEVYMQKKEVYIYMLEIENNGPSDWYYVGKTFQLEKRLIDHIKGNRKSAKLLKEHNIVSIKEIHHICINESDEELSDAEADSISSRLENRFIAQKIAKVKDDKEIYRGGHYLEPWENNQTRKIKPFKPLDLEQKKYRDLNQYKSHKVSKDKGHEVQDFNRKNDIKAKGFVSDVMQYIENR